MTDDIWTIYIDHDTPFQYALNPESRYRVFLREAYTYLETKKPFYAVYGEVLPMRIRESSAGNTHVAIRLHMDETPQPELDLMYALCARAVMHDDSKRLRADLERMLLGQYLSVGKIFSTKKDIVTGITRHAGPWIEI